MEPKYIVAIATVGVFFIFFLIFFALLAHRRNCEAKLQARIQDFYSDRNLVKVDYDSAADEDVPTLIEGRNPVSAETEEETQLKIEEVFTKVDVEGIEEITGNYQP